MTFNFRKSFIDGSEHGESKFENIPLFLWPLKDISSVNSKEEHNDDELKENGYCVNPVFLAELPSPMTNHGGSISGNV